MTEEAVRRARTEASRGGYASMARLARALYESGLGPRDVLRECYGTDFPEEFFLLTDKGPHKLGLIMDFTNQPWRLAVPLSQGGPAPEPDSRDRIERRVFARDPHLVPLALPLGMDAIHEDQVICYHVDELRAGRPTTFGIHMDVDPDDEIERYGVSLLEIIRQHHADYLRLLVHQRHLPSNRGTGSVDAGAIGGVQEIVNRIEALQRALPS